MAKSACTEGEYYEDLLTYYRHNLRVFISPSHCPWFCAQEMYIQMFLQQGST